MEFPDAVARHAVPPSEAKGGEQVSQTHTPIPTPVPSGAHGIAGFVSGFIALVFTLSVVWAPISPLFAVLALVFGLIGRSESRNQGAPHGGLARAGWIMGSIALFLFFQLQSMSQYGGVG